MSDPGAMHVICFTLLWTLTSITVAKALKHGEHGDECLG
jgi:hypothetical protein